MKSKELRLGNIVLEYLEDEDRYIESKVSCWDFEKARLNNNQDDFYWLEPIPLTEEWINRFIFNDAHWASSWIMLEMPVPTGINYVHQLQNLYFALTGEELTLKN